MAQAYDPGKPDGENATLQQRVSANGVAVYDQHYVIAPRTGMAVLLEQGDHLEVINPKGTQVCDFWAFNADDTGEFLSMAHVHTALESIFPGPGDPLVSNLRRTLLTLVEDTSPGVHDTVIASCDHQRYQQLGCTSYHDNCVDNLRMAFMAIGKRASSIPAPFNLWMNIPVADDGSTQWRAPVAKPGDRVVFRAEASVLAVMSACPQDITPVNGDNCEPVELQFCVRNRCA